MLSPVDPSAPTDDVSPLAEAPPDPPEPNATADAIHANMATPPLAGPVPPLDVARAQATQLAMRSRQWMGQLNQLASAFGIHLGGSFAFAQRGVAQLDAALARDASAEQLDRLTKRLQGDWMVRGPAVFDRLNHGMFRNAERGLRQAAVNLARAGVTGAPLQAYREAARTLRRLEASGAPGSESMLQLKAMLDQTMAKVARPEHRPAQHQALSSAQTSINWMVQGLTVSEALRRTVGMGIDLPGLSPAPPPDDAVPLQDAA